MAMGGGGFSMEPENRLLDVVSSRPNAKGYRVGVRDGSIVEDELVTRYLGS